VDENSARSTLHGARSLYDRNSEYDNYFNDIARACTSRSPHRAARIRRRLHPLAHHHPEHALQLQRYIRYRPETGGLGFDLTSLGFPSSYATAIAPRDRRYPKLSTWRALHPRPDTTLTVVPAGHDSRHRRHADQDSGKPIPYGTGRGIRAYQETTLNFGRPGDRSIQFRLHLYPRTVGQLADLAEQYMASRWRRWNWAWPPLRPAVTRAPASPSQSQLLGRFVHGRMKVTLV